MVVDSDIVAGGLTVFLLICFRPKKGEDSMMPFSETIVGGRKTKKLSIVINLMAFQRQWRSRVSAFSRNDWNLWSFGFRYVAMKKYPLLNQKVHLQSWSVFQPAILALPELFTLSDPCLMPGKYRRVNDGKNSKYRPPLYESMEKKKHHFWWGLGFWNTNSCYCPNRASISEMEHWRFVGYINRHEPLILYTSWKSCIWVNPKKSLHKLKMSHIHFCINMEQRRFLLRK